MKSLGRVIDFEEREAAAAALAVERARLCRAIGSARAAIGLRASAGASAPRSARVERGVRRRQRSWPPVTCRKAVCRPAELARRR